jgi:hypothetical protein
MYIGAEGEASAEPDIPIDRNTAAITKTRPSNAYPPCALDIFILPTPNEMGQYGRRTFNDLA